MRIDLERPARAFLGLPPSRPGRLQSGLPALDDGLGGLPRGAVVEVRGEPGAGKSALARELLAELAPRARTAALDLSGELPRVPGALYAAPRSGEEALRLLRALLLTRALDLIVVDPARALGDAAGRPLLVWTLPALHAQAVHSGACLLLVDSGLDAHRAPARFHIDATLHVERGAVRLTRASPRCGPLQSAPAPRGPS